MSSKVLHTFILHATAPTAVYVTEESLSDDSKVYDVMLTGPVLLANARDYAAAFECARAIQAACRGAA